MSDEPADRLSPAEERVRALLEPLRETQAPHGRELVARVGRSARWQRPVRRVVLAVGHAAAALGAGIGALARGGRRA
jgi:hypothetical protein